MVVRVIALHEKVSVSTGRAHAIYFAPCRMRAGRRYLDGISGTLLAYRARQGVAASLSTSRSGWRGRTPCFGPLQYCAGRKYQSVPTVTLRNRGRKNRLEYVDANKGLIASWLGRALGFLGPETEFPVGRILTPSDCHNSTFLFIR